MIGTIALGHDGGHVLADQLLGVILEQFGRLRVDRQDHTVVGGEHGSGLKLVEPHSGRLGDAGQHLGRAVGRVSSAAGLALAAARALLAFVGQRVLRLGRGGAQRRRPQTAPQAGESPPLCALRGSAVTVTVTVGAAVLFVFVVHVVVAVRSRAGAAQASLEEVLEREGAQRQQCRQTIEALADGQQAVPLHHGEHKAEAQLVEVVQAHGHLMPVTLVQVVHHDEEAAHQQRETGQQLVAAAVTLLAAVRHRAGATAEEAAAQEQVPRVHQRGEIELRREGPVDVGLEALHLVVPRDRRVHVQERVIVDGVAAARHREALAAALVTHNGEQHRDHLRRVHAQQHQPRQELAARRRLDHLRQRQLAQQQPIHALAEGALQLCVAGRVAQLGRQRDAVQRHAVMLRIELLGVLAVLREQLKEVVVVERENDRRQLADALEDVHGAGALREQQVVVLGHAGLAGRVRQRGVGVPATLATDARTLIGRLQHQPVAAEARRQRLRELGVAVAVLRRLLGRQTAERRVPAGLVHQHLLETLCARVQTQRAET
mmetsp:Transcript_13317/g.33949  ORF Transcript_13317/g.33949 Transcript_13317/m.33949 type:complete len:546 (-) Transcript_13317:400-2037(-)